MLLDPKGFLGNVLHLIDVFVYKFCDPGTIYFNFDVVEANMTAAFLVESLLTVIKMLKIFEAKGIVVLLDNNFTQ